jgi:hypothetical protein
VADADLWGGHREVFVDGPETADTVALDDAGEDALLEGGASTSVTMEAQEPKGTKAFRAFQPGDRVTAFPYPTVEIPDVVEAIRVVHDTQGEPVVTPVFGNPDDDDADALTAQLIRALRREVANFKINKNRGAT